MKAATVLALSVCILASCSRSGPQKQPSAKEQPTPKKHYYFVRKVDGKLTTLQPELGEFKDAQRVEGQITGAIVHRSSATGKEKTKEGKYIYTFFVTEGKDIEMIDNSGLYHAIGSNVVLLVANLEKPDVDDLEFLLIGMASKANTSILNLYSGGTMTRFVSQTKKQGAGTLPLMGEYQTMDGKPRVIPALQVNTDSGVAQIPLDQLIPFRKKTEQPSPAK